MVEQNLRIAMRHARLFELRTERSFGTANRKEDIDGPNRFSMIIPSLAPEAKDLALDRLLSPARHYKHPDDVLRDGALDRNEKRAILSSWASDACAVESMPALRRPTGVKQPISFDSIMDALRRLDGPAATLSDRIEVMGRSERQRLDA
ncbi:hypothetical protein [Mesorhizobium sp. IMUNJ 23232]|uniref:hypothetical protein n=1 Tax=Mesorhizobium sp. IMUNJ 23232 TaxID=3376064 RepID=UPI0037A52170